MCQRSALELFPDPLLCSQSQELVQAGTANVQTRGVGFLDDRTLLPITQ